jgi:hypothetical protein
VNPIKLTETLQFLIEPTQKRIRVVVLKNGQEWVCRRENYRNLVRFSRMESGRLFKGRLQLHLVENKIKIDVKGVTIGVVPVDDFRQWLMHGKPTIQSEV